MKKVTILMNCFNGEKYLKSALDSIYAQTYENFEIIFIDNCSTDSSAAIANSYDKRLSYFSTPNKMSLAQARAFAKSLVLNGDFFCVLDVDDLWMPDKLEKQVRTMNENQEVGLVYSNTVFFKDSGEEKVYYNSIMPSGNIFEKILSNYFFSFETVMVRTTLLKQHNIYFDPKYNVSSDAELFIRICHKTKVIYINECLAKWRCGHASESTQQFCSFPREFEMLLEDLSKSIPDFDTLYAKSINSLKGKIYNMYGLCFWKQDHISKAKKYFFNATKISAKYIIPLGMIYFMKYATYQNLRSKFKFTQ
jgi:glycosyltransferase involved in cell wall biosynthesis